MPKEQTSILTKMPLPSLRRKSRPANIARPEPTANASFPAGEALPVPTDGPEPVLTPHMQPRPRSSWYSQASVLYAAPLGYTNPYASLPVPAYLSTSAPTPLTPTALQSLDEAVRRAASEEWEDDELPESPGGTRQSTLSPYMSRNKHTAVSEYLQERAWMPFTPTLSHAPPVPTLIPPPVPTQSSSVFRRFSVASDKDRPLSRRASRRESTKSKRSSLTTLPYPISIHEQDQLGQLARLPQPVTPVQQVTPATTRQTPSSKSSSPFSSFSLTRSRTKPSTAATSPAASTPATDPFTATAYEEPRRGRSPIPVPTLHAFDTQAPSKGAAPAALIQGLSQKYGGRPPSTQTQKQPQPTQDPPTSYHADAVRNHFGSAGVSVPNRIQSQNHSRAMAPLNHKTQPRTQAQNLLHPRRAATRLLNTRTRDPAETSDEGSWLYIGTLRGPTPAGVRMIDELMSKSVEKKGTAEKGIKEIRKLLRYESRTTIEWTETYLKRRWAAAL